MSCGKMRSRGRVKRQIKMPRVKKPARAMSAWRTGGTIAADQCEIDEVVVER